MSRLLDDDEDLSPARERELTLSTGAILAIFLGLVLLCAVFFGFGYNLGRKSTNASNAALPASTTDTEPAETGNSTFDSFKPSPGSPSAPASNPSSLASAPTSTATSGATTAEPAASVPAPRASSPPPAPVPAQPAAATPARVPVRTPPPAAQPKQPPATATTPSGSFVVQIAAISPAHKDDADLLANALRSKGYDVAEKTGSQDQLIHIQVGPFATKADAEAMRERLIVDGYNAIVK